MNDGQRVSSASDFHESSSSEEEDVRAARLEQEASTRRLALLRKELRLNIRYLEELEWDEGRSEKHKHRTTNSSPPSSKQAFGHTGQPSARGCPVKQSKRPQRSSRGIAINGHGSQI